MIPMSLSSLLPALGALLAFIVIGLTFGVAALGMAGIKVDPNSDFVKLMAKLGFTDALGGPRYSFVNSKTANYAILTTADPSGTVFDNRGSAGAVTYTLPAPTQALAGTFYEFFGVADQNTIVSAGAGLGVAFNNAACASLACSTAGAKIGAHIRAVCDGTSWKLLGDSVGVTYTVA